ncbi:hypothetical protein Acr_00g0095830 [Actinidia rufa]|uniref:Uncharacterized protein n=1 Tax=Actinidia rufa TaxID=165716 RepID=A0A7J0DYN5_9ERIC|nr:hypothetical protein Acr_00g0095830 [Actinidia rufa]
MTHASPCGWSPTAYVKSVIMTSLGIKGRGSLRENFVRRLSKAEHHGIDDCDALLGKLPSLPPVHVVFRFRGGDNAVVCASPTSWTCLTSRAVSNAAVP